MRQSTAAMMVDCCVLRTGPRRSCGVAPSPPATHPPSAVAAFAVLASVRSRAPPCRHQWRWHQSPEDVLPVPSRRQRQRRGQSRTPEERRPHRLGLPLHLVRRRRPGRDGDEAGWAAAAMPRRDDDDGAGDTMGRRRRRWFRWRGLSGRGGAERSWVGRVWTRRRRSSVVFVVVD